MNAVTVDLRTVIERIRPTMRRILADSIEAALTTQTGRVGQPGVVIWMAW